MEAKEIYASLEKLFPGKVRDFKGDVYEPYLNVEKEDIVEICRFLRTAQSFRFEVLSDLTAHRLAQGRKDPDRLPSVFLRA